MGVLPVRSTETGWLKMLKLVMTTGGGAGLRWMSLGRKTLKPCTPPK